MITAIVRFKAPAGADLAKATEMFKGTAPKYQGMPGLVRKYYLFGDDGLAGGVYLWENRAAAERVYNDEWRRTLTERYGAEPEIAYYESPVIVDNTTGTIQTDAAA